MAVVSLLLLDWYPRLKNAAAAQREAYEITPMGIHWPALDEDLSITGMLKGRKAGSLPRYAHFFSELYTTRMKFVLA